MKLMKVEIPNYITLMALTLLCLTVNSQGVEKYQLDNSENITRAELWVQNVVDAPRAVIVLCPAKNESGLSMVEDKRWIDFAKANACALVGLSFSSPQESINKKRGYIFPEHESGLLFLNAKNKIWGEDTPLLIHGFGAGGVFACKFSEWRPDVVKAVSAYGMKINGLPPEQDFKRVPPVLLGCGSEDVTRLSGALRYFTGGRKMEFPWAWVSIAGLEHEQSVQFESLTQSFFANILGVKQDPVFYDIDLKTEFSEHDLIMTPEMGVWMPNRQVASEWIELHEP